MNLRLLMEDFIKNSKLNDIYHISTEPQGNCDKNEILSPPPFKKLRPDFAKVFFLKKMMDFIKIE